MTVTVSSRSTGAARVSVTALPATTTGLVSARSAALPPTVTVKSPAAGREPASVARPPSKVIVSAARFTDADENTGGVLLVTVRSEKPAAAFPKRSCNGVPAFAGTYHALTVWPWVTARSSLSVSVTVESAMEAAPSSAAPTPSTRTWNAPASGTEPASRTSSKVSVTVRPFTAALRNAGGVTSPVPLNTGRPENSGTSLPRASCSGAVSGGS